MTEYVVLYTYTHCVEGHGMITFDYVEAKTPEEAKKKLTKQEKDRGLEHIVCVAEVVWKNRR